MTQFVICISNESNPASLTVGKVYQILADEEAEQHGLLRIIDEDMDEEDGYLYPSSMFVPTADYRRLQGLSEQGVLSRVNGMLARLAKENAGFSEAEVAADVAEAVKEVRNSTE